MFASVPTFDTWVADLRCAGIEYPADDGTIAGCHSLRVTYVTELQEAGLSARVVMELARHTNYRLRATTYTDMRMIDTFGAVAVLPTDARESNAQTARRTGTDDLPVKVDQMRDRIDRSNVQTSALLCSDADSCMSHVPCDRTGRVAAQGSAKAVLAGERNIAAERI